MRSCNRLPANSLSVMPEEGLEPSRDCSHRILSAWLPCPTSGTRRHLPAKNSNVRDVVRTGVCPPVTSSSRGSRHNRGTRGGDRSPAFSLSLSAHVCALALRTDLQTRRIVDPERARNAPSVLPIQGTCVVIVPSSSVSPNHLSVTLAAPAKAPGAEPYGTL